MFGNYIKITLRTLFKHKAYSFINIFGLAVGITCCLLILLFVQDELNYDRFHPNAGQIYRITTEIDWSGGHEEAASAQFPVAPVLMNDYPQIVNTCRLLREQNFPAIRYRERQFIEEQFFFSDPSFFEIFSFELAEGNPETALREPNSVIISEAVARKYFGSENPLGKLLIYQNERTLKVTAVIKSIPANSHLKFDFLVPFEFHPNVRRLEQNWFWNGFWTYLFLPDEKAAAELEGQFPAFVQKYFPESIREGTTLLLQRLTDIHLHSQLSNEIEANSNIIYIYVFSAIAFLVLLIACINFMNLATARSAKRAKEVGLRKVLGAYRADLIKQFLGEAILLSFLAVALALCLAELSLPLFNLMVGKALTVDFFHNWVIWSALIGIGLFVGIVSGSYPAFFLSAFQPSGILKGILSESSPGMGGSKGGLRKILVTGQFTVSVVLLIAIGVISQQLNFFRNKPLGFNKDQVLLLRSRPEVNRQFEAFENELRKHPAVLDVSRATGSIPGEATWGFRFVPEGTRREKPKAMQILYVDYDFASVFGLEIREGRDFSQEFPADLTTAFILNEAAVKELSWEGAALGKRMEYFGAGSPEIEKSGTVVGVVKDFHYESLHRPVLPLVLTLTTPDNRDRAVVKISPQNIPATLAFLEQKWNQFVPDWPLQLSFLDKNLDQQYNKEAKLSQIIQYFTILAIFIACLGLFGLAAFAAEQRTKEIGVRKVLGASVPNIIFLLSKQFMILVIAANIIAWPVAYLAMNRWLQEFAYRIDMGWQTFLLAGGAAFAIAVLMVSYQAIKAAVANPVESLRYE